MNTTAVDRNTSKEAPDDSYLRIGEAAEQTGLTQRTIRYYEELGLLPPPTRTQGDYRLFSGSDLNRLREIVRLKNLLGFSLSEIKEIVENDEARSQLRSEFRATDDPHTRLQKLSEATRIVESQLALIGRKMAQMDEMRSELAAKLERFATLEKELREKELRAQKESGTGKGVVGR